MNSDPTVTRLLPGVSGRPAEYGQESHPWASQKGASVPKGIYKRNAKDAATQTAAPPVKRGRKPKPSGGSSATLQLAGRTIQVRIDESGAIHVSVLTP